jgi:hypothetical protein
MHSIKEKKLFDKIRTIFNIRNVMLKPIIVSKGE